MPAPARSRPTTRIREGRDALDIAHYSFDSLAPGRSHWKCVRRAHPYFADRRFDCAALEFAIRAPGSVKNLKIGSQFTQVLEGSMLTLWAQSMFGAETRKGLVELSYENDEGPNMIGICTPAEARAFALTILEAAESAETDQLVMEWLRERIGVKDDEAAVAVLKDFRDRREQYQKGDKT